MPSRRDFLKKAAYVAPAIVTLNAVPAFAGAGSDRRGHGNRGGHGSRGGHGNRHRRRRHG